MIICFDFSMCLRITTCIYIYIEYYIAREGAKLFTKEGEEVGIVTSGAHSPCLKKNIGMGYVKKELQKAGTELEVYLFSLCSLHSYITY